MTNKQVEEKLTELVHREPFVPFVVDLVDGKSLLLTQPPVFDETGAGYINSDGALADFEFERVCAIRQIPLEPVACIYGASAMDLKQIELQVTELKHRRPFVPFAFEMVDGQLLEVLEPGLALDETGVGFFNADDALVDVEFKNVRAIRLLTAEVGA